MTTISALPPAPQPTDDTSTFNAKAFALLAALTTFISETNLVAGETNSAASSAHTDAVSAAAQAAAAAATLLACIANANAAATSAGASPWASGSYSAGAPARSTIDFRIYSARTTGSKPTDPSLDPTNWGLASPNSLQMIAVTGTTQTAAVGGRYILKNAAASTLTAPPTPQAGDEFAVKWVNGRFDNLINWNGAKCEGLSDATTTLNESPRGSAHWIYIDSTTGWARIA